MTIMMLAKAELLRAANYIEEHGWCQGHYRNVEGQVCLMGALEIVADSGVMLCHTTTMVQRMITKRGSSYSVVKWNDEPGRTKEEVMTLLREAAQLPCRLY